MKLVKQAFVFGMLSGVGTALHFVVLYSLVEFAGVPPLASSIAGAVCGMLFNYVAHYHLTFVSEAPHLRSMPLFFAGGVTSIGLNTLIMGGLLGTGINYLLAQVLTTAIVFAFNFTYAKLVAFRK